MEAQEILEMMKRVDARESEKKESPEVYDEQIAQMAESPGWESMVAIAEKRICKLLEPISDEDIISVGSGGLNLIAAMAIARSQSVKELRNFIGIAVGTQNARSQMKSNLEKEMSESGAK